MKLRKLTIRNLLFITSIGIAFILLFIAVLANWHIKETFSDHQLIIQVEQLYSSELYLRQTEKDFLIYETINPDFFKKGKSEYLVTISQTLDDIQTSLSLLQKEPRIKKLKLEDDLYLIKTKFNSYEKELDRLTVLILNKGFKDYGLVGDMRNSIHKLESELSSFNNNEYLVKMLMLRRHEKDYLLRKDIKYEQKFVDKIVEFQELLKKDSEGKKLIPDLIDYQIYFHKVIQVDSEIGMTEDHGLMKIHNELVSFIETDLLRIRDIIKAASAKSIKKTIYTLFASFLGLSLFIILILQRVSKFIVTSITILREYITRLGEGELPEEIKVVNDDEIGNIKRSINLLTKNLKKTKEFAIAVGNGNFEKDIDVFNNSGDLGGSLVNMREKLLQVATDRKLQEQKDKQRIWVNEGLAIFSDILRKNISTQSKMYKKILASLVDYVGASQGAFFIVNDDDETVDLSLEACYALNREKYVERKLKPGETLVGECYLEKKSIFITDIPKNYGPISVGLGGFKPVSIYIVPLLFDSKVVGVIELTSVNVFDDIIKKFIDRTSNDIASYISVDKINKKTQDLLEQSKLQAAELVSNKEELDQNLEEMTCVQENYEVREREMTIEIADLKAELEKRNLLLKSDELFNS